MYGENCFCLRILLVKNYICIQEFTFAENDISSKLPFSGLLFKTSNNIYIFSKHIAMALMRLTMLKIGKSRK
jgi:hypothetical protein